jgi:hypothetical protein
MTVSNHVGGDLNGHGLDGDGTRRFPGGTAMVNREARLIPPGVPRGSPGLNRSFNRAGHAGLGAVVQPRLRWAGSHAVATFIAALARYPGTKGRHAVGWHDGQSGMPKAPSADRHDVNTTGLAEMASSMRER